MYTVIEFRDGIITSSHIESQLSHATESVAILVSGLRARKEPTTTQQKIVFTIEHNGVTIYTEKVWDEVR